MRAALGTLALGLLSTLAPAQTLSDDGQVHVVPYTSAHGVQDFTVPSGVVGLEITLRGGAGGNASDGGCNYDGGKGALVVATFVVGTGPGAIPPGSTVRFIVGQQGGSNPLSYIGGAGGGGGSALLYRTPSLNHYWHLAVAGGGGGAWAMEDGICRGNDGRDASLTEDGGDATNTGGTGGVSGGPGASFSYDNSFTPGLAGGGGGAYIDPNYYIYAGLGGEGGDRTGGNGGQWSGLGGWGFGGGGVGHEAGGGGGGFSGGSAGYWFGDDFNDGGGGGGGGCMVSDKNVSKSLSVASAGGHGEATYRCIPEQVAAPQCGFAAQVDEGNFSGNTSAAIPNTVLRCDLPGIIFQSSVWYQLSNANDFAIDVTADTSNSPGNSVVKVDVRSVCSDVSTTAADVACGSGFPHQSVTWTMQPGTTHFLRVGTGDIIPGNNVYELSISKTPAAVSNATCATAEAIGLGSHSESNWGTGNSGNSLPCDGDTVSDAWYTYENPNPWPVQLDVTVTPGSSFDGLGLEAVSGCGGSSLACASVVDGQPASITFDVPAEAERKFRVASVFGNDSDYELILAATYWPVWNDTCATAEPISQSSGTLTWTTTGATATSPMAAGSAINQDVWFQYTNPYAADRFVRLTTQKLDLGDEFAVEVYDACGGQLVASAQAAASAAAGWIIPGGATHKMRVASTGMVGEPNWFQVMLEEDSAPFP
ncbi:MAG: hypothetical protein GY772_32090, partial [bacterium]|nr:hypothetical protein [bacterium]